MAGQLIEIEKRNKYEFQYLDSYVGDPVSLTLPTSQKTFSFDRFPTFFEGFLPEGIMLEALLKKTKLNRNDLFEQLMRVGGELVGDVTIQEDNG